MKKSIIILLLCSISLVVKSQDIIFLNTGEEIQAKILEIGTETVKYKKIDNKGDFPGLYVISKSDIFMIKYKDGTKDVFEQTKIAEAKPESVYGSCIQAEEDALLNYKAKVGGTTFISTMIIPVVGLFVAIGSSSNPPSENSLRPPKPESFDDANYKSCYKNEAHRMKKKKIWGSFAGAIVLDVAVFFIIKNIIQLNSPKG